MTLHLTNPLAWGHAAPALWVPSAGIGLALVAWFGPRAALLVALDGLLVAAQAKFLGTPSDGPAPGWAATGLAAADALILAVGIALGWWVYHHRGRGSRRLTDPRSAILFLLLVPGAAAGFCASLRLGLYALAGEATPSGRALAAFWLEGALGMLVVAPPLLAACTPWLARRRLAVAEPVESDPPAERAPVGTDRPGWGDWLESAGLALSAGGLGLLLPLASGERLPAGWQLWGAPLLLIVWASLRQGVRGGTLAAAAAAAPALLVLGRGPAGTPALLLAQGNLLAQCAAALLVASAAGWIRMSEERYRRVVAHIPVVLYSARVVGPPPPGGRTPAAEVTLVSDASGALLGCPPDQLLGDFEHWLERVHPADREVVVAAVAQLGRQRQPVTCEYRLAPTPRDSWSAESDGWNLAARAARAGALPPLSQLPGKPPDLRWVRDTLAPDFDSDGRLAGWEGVVVDITGQRALADDLRRTTSMFHTLVDNLPAGVFFVSGSQGRPLLVNARARQLLGQREDASAGLEHLAQVYRLFRADGTPYPHAELPVVAALRRGGPVMCDDVVVHRPDGRKLPLVSWAAPVEPGGGTAGGAVWVFEDLAVLRKSEAARRGGGELPRAAFEATAGAVVALDRDGKVVEANPAAAALLGAAAGAVPAAEFLREDGTPLPADEHPAAAALRAGRPARKVLLGVRRPGAAVRWALADAVPLGHGPAAVAVTTFADVTALREERDGLRASEARFRDLFEAMPLMLVQADRGQRITYANPAVGAVSGYTLDEIADPAAWGRLLHPEDLPKVRQLVAEALAGWTGRGEARYRSKDGTDKVAYLFTQPRREGDAVIGVTTLMVDVTRERRLEQELERSQRLELVGRLSSGVAHDFNNLLGVVLSLTDLARGQLPGTHPVQDDLRRIAEAGEQAAALAAQLLAFGKPRRPGGARVDVGRVARQTLELVRATLPPTVRVEDGLGDGLAVRGDETQLRQVLMNLCLNARDAMPEGGTLRVTADAAAAPSGGPGGGPEDDDALAEWVRLTVADTGSGMSEEVQARAFDPFFSTKEHGTGLGLAVVRQIVEGAGGRVTVHSRPGAGTRFEVWLPLADAAEPAYSQTG